MIRIATGEFKLDDYDLIVRPELTLSEFRKGDIPVTAILNDSKHSGEYQFVGSIDGLKSRFQIAFRYERLRRMHFLEDVVLYDQKAIDQELLAATKTGHEVYIRELRKWTEIVQRADRKQLDRLDAWLEKVIGAPPPYEYDNWGEIVSVIDPRAEEVLIVVRFRHDFGENADLKAYFENRRNREHQLAMNPPQPFIPGKLPPGFRPK